MIEPANHPLSMTVLMTADTANFGGYMHGRRGATLPVDQHRNLRVGQHLLRLAADQHALHAAPAV